MSGTPDPTDGMTEAEMAEYYYRTRDLSGFDMEHPEPVTILRNGFDKGDREYPYWDEKIQSMVYGHYGDWLVSVTPMIFNDRVLLTHRARYPLEWVAGWCYDKGGAAGLAAMAWDPSVDDEPVGYKKVAADNR